MDADPKRCAACNEPIPDTPTGRRSRAKRCKRCNHAAWYSRQTPEFLHALYLRGKERRVTPLHLPLPKRTEEPPP